VLASFPIFIAAPSVAQLPEPQAEPMHPRPKVFCVNIPETRDAKARIICFTRGLAIGSQTNPKSSKSSGRNCGKNCSGVPRNAAACYRQRHRRQSATSSISRRNSGFR